MFIFPSSYQKWSIRNLARIDAALREARRLKEETDGPPTKDESHGEQSSGDKATAGDLTSLDITRTRSATPKPSNVNNPFLEDILIEQIRPIVQPEHKEEWENNVKVHTRHWDNHYGRQREHFHSGSTCH